jgi:hypothetical protein
MAKMQMFGEAVKAKTTVRVDAPRSKRLRARWPEHLHRHAADAR